MESNLQCDFKSGCWCRNKKILENPYPAPLACPFENQASQQRFCKGYTGIKMVWDLVLGELIARGLMKNGK